MIIVLILALFINAGIYDNNLSSYIDYVIVNEYENCIRRDEELIFDFVRFKEQVKIKVNSFDEMDNRIKNITFTKRGLAIQVNVAYQIYYVERIIKKEVGINEKNQRIDNYHPVNVNLEYSF